MTPQQAKDLVQQQSQVLRNWVCDHCGEEKHLIPLALIYVHKRLSDQDWEQVRKYADKQPFVEFINVLVKEALESFSHGIWFGKCSSIIDYWLTHYSIHNVNKQQDAEDYIKDKLVHGNFARFKSHDKESHTHFTTYISKVIRNLLIDYLRKKTPETQPLENAENDDSFEQEMITSNTVDLYKQQNLEEIGKWFFASTPQESNPAATHSIDVPDALKLSSKDRLFLRAMYKDGLSVEKAGRLPGINMGKWQAHGYHRRLKTRIKKLLKTMGYETIQSLLYAS